MDATETLTGRTRVTHFLKLAVDLLIAALVLGLPFIMGGREAWGHWFLISAALLLGAAWSAWALISGFGYRVSWLELFLIAGLSIAWVQTQPLTPQQLNSFSTEYERLLPSWSVTQTDSADGISWKTLSLAPAETAHAWWVFLAYAIILTVLFQRLREPEDCRKLLKCVAVSGVLMTVFGLLQWGTSNGRFFWHYEHPFTDTTTHLKGAFTNRNHFAQFVALSVAPLLWWLFRRVAEFTQESDQPAGTRTPHRKAGKRREEREFVGPAFRQALGLPILLLLGATALAVVGVLLSLSRGGMLAAGAALVIGLIGLWRGFRLGGAMAAILIGGGVLLLAFLSLADQEQLQVKVDQLISADMDRMDMGGVRRAIWAADGKVIDRFPLLGTGVGSHRDVYPLYMEDFADYAQAELTHAESSFVQTALETGWIGVGLLAALLAFLLLRLLAGAFFSRSPDSRAIAVAVLASTVGAILHAVADFIWYVPAIVVVSICLIAVGLRSVSRTIGTPERLATRPFSRIAWAGSACLCLVGLIHVQSALLARVSAERHYFAALLTELEVAAADTEGYDDLEAGDAVLVLERDEMTVEEQESLQDEQAARAKAAELAWLSQRIRHLSASLRAQPEQHRVQLMLSEHLLTLFDRIQAGSENPFVLKMLRDAASTSGFATSAELMDWLKLNCGNRLNLVLTADRLLRDSLRGCPVQGHAYLALMETSFLHNPENPLHQDLIDQAMLVRGHDPRVRFVAGREAILQQDWEKGFELWESVFHSNQYFRLTILQMVAQQAPAEFFIREFQPDSEELEDLLTVYDSLEREQDAVVLLRELCRVIPAEAPGIEDDDERLATMIRAYTFARRLNDLDLSIRLLTAAADEFPLEFEPKYYLGMTLVELERPEEAMEYLEWCYDQDPGNIWIPKLIVRARKQILKLERDQDDAESTALLTKTDRL